MMAIAMGLHVRCGIEDNLWNQARTAKMSPCSRSSSWCASRASSAATSPPARKAREIYRIGEFYDTADETLAAQRLRAEPQGPAARPAQGGRVMRDHVRATVLIVPGCATTSPSTGRRCSARCARRAACAPCRRWAARTSTAPRAAPRSSARRRRSRAAGRRRAQRRRGHARALGAADPPPGPRRAAGDAARLRAADARGLPDHRALRAGGWLPVPRERLPFPSIVAASRNDPLARFDRVAGLARDWGSRLVDLGQVGHLNPASGFGEWPRRKPDRRTRNSRSAHDRLTAARPWRKAHGPRHPLPRDRRPEVLSSRPSRSASPARPGARAAHLRRRQLHRHLFPHRPLSAAAAQRPRLRRRGRGRGRRARASPTSRPATASATCSARRAPIRTCA